MFRIILGIIASMFLFSVVRTIIGAMKKEFHEQQQGAAGSGPEFSRSSAPRAVGGELRKCPSCGTYHAVGNIAGKTKGGQLVHFCSLGCREKFGA